MASEPYNPLNPCLKNVQSIYKYATKILSKKTPTTSAEVVTPHP